MPSRLRSLRERLRVLSEDPRELAPVVALTILALAPRAWFVLEEHRPESYVVVDMALYVERAQRLISAPLQPGDAFLPVGYPAFVALLVSGGSLTTVAWAQMLLSALTAGLTYPVARNVLSPDWSAAAGLAVAAYVPLVLYSGFFLPETCFTFALLAFMALALRTAARPSYASGLPAGLFAGIAASLHPNALLLLPLLGLVGLITKIPKPFIRSVFLGATPVLLAFAAFNTAVSDHLTFTSTNGGINFFAAQSEYTTVRGLNDPLALGISPRPNIWRSGGELRVDRYAYDDAYFYRRAFTQFRAHPASTLRWTGRNILNGLGIGPVEYWPGSSRFNSLLDGFRYGFFWIGILPAAASCCHLLLSRHAIANPAKLLLILSLCVPLFSQAAYLGDPRIRVPFDAFIIILSLAFWASFAQTILRQWRDRCSGTRSK